MFYIRHGSDNFTIIDCCLSSDNRVAIVDEIMRERYGKNIIRFISTHPDDDHIRGLDYLDDRLQLLNFYCVANAAVKTKNTDDFDNYCVLRDSDKAFNLSKGRRRRWMNQTDEDRGSAGLSILWPAIKNSYYIRELAEVACGKSPNNISPIIKYEPSNNAIFLWMGDLETDFMENIYDSVSLPEVDILFAPHHGRNSGRVPKRWLDDLSPRIIIIGEASSDYLNYYEGYNTITQNSAGNISFECDGSDINIYTSIYAYSVNFLFGKYLAKHQKFYNDYYLGTLKL